MPDATPSVPRHVDTFIVGGGQAGVPLSFALAKAGHAVALAERKHLGGTCVNYGCTPTKAALASAHVAHQARDAERFGVRVGGPVEVDFGAVLDRAERILRVSRNGLQDSFTEGENPHLVRGHARLDGRDDRGRFRLQVTGEGGAVTEMTAERVVVNSGARTAVPPIDGLEDVGFIHAGNWLDHRTRPEHLVMVGGGVIGVEMGQFYRRMGSRVTLVQSGPRLLPAEDPAVGEVLHDVFADEGISIHYDSLATAVRPLGDDRVEVTVSHETEDRPLEATHVFLATGRRPNTDDLGLHTVGLTPGDGGFLEVDAALRTDVDGIWATGDVRGGPMFTHTSYDDHRVVANHLTGDGTHTTDRVVPYAVFTDPELGRVGLTEDAAREAGHNVTTARYDMRNNGKAFEIGRTTGFIKVVADAETRTLLGATVLSEAAAEIVHGYVTLMNAGATVDVMQDAVHIHPTLSEAVQSALSGLGVVR